MNTKNAAVRSLRGVALVLGAMLVPATAFAAGDGEGAPVAQLLSAIVNFAIYIGAIVWFGGPMVKKAFQERADQFRSKAEESARREQAAREKLAQAQERIATLAQERDEMVTSAKQLGEAERDRMIASAKEQAAKLREDATLSIAAEARRNEAALRDRLFERALELAEQELAKGADARRHAQWIDAGIDEYAASGVALH